MDPVPLADGEGGQVVRVPLSEAVRIAIKHNPSLPRKGQIHRMPAYERRVRSVFRMNEQGLGVPTIARSTGFTKVDVIRILEKHNRG